MSKSDIFCIICGKHLSESDGGDICSENCNNAFNDFKSNPNLTYINGFCNLCGQFHELEKNSHYGRISHRHDKCYSAYSTYSKSHIQIVDEEDLRRKQERQKLLLSNGKIYDSYSNLLFCPYCNTYSVIYFNKTNQWSCNECNKNIVMKNSKSNYPFAFGLNFTIDDKYKIYKCYGIESLVELTGDARDEIKKLIGSHFENECTSIGSNCLYYNHFKEADVAKQIKLIDNLFKKSKFDCNSLRNEIDCFLDNIESKQSNSDDAPQKLLCNDFMLIKHVAEELNEIIDEYFIAVANTSLMKDEKVSFREEGDNLLAERGGDTYDGFCWNDAQKDDFVGVCATPSYALNQTEKDFEEFKEKYEEASIEKYKEPSIEKKRMELKYLELNAFDTIHQSGGIYQCQLWKELDIDSRKCTRIVKSLLYKELIEREHATCNGSRTYMLNIKF